MPSTDPTSATSTASPSTTPAAPATATVQLTAVELAMVRGGLQMKIAHHARLAVRADLIQAARDDHASRQAVFKALDTKLAAVSVAPAAA